jgi:hypothetical protein
MDLIEQITRGTDRTKYFNPDRGPDLRRMNDLDRIMRPRTWHVNEIHGMHHEIIRLLMLGMKNVDIAKRIGCTEVQVSSIKNSPIVLDRLALMNAARDIKSIDISKDIMEVAPEALKLLKKIVRGEEIGAQVAPLGLQAKTAESLLDRAGFGAVKKVATSNEHVFYTNDEIEALKARARENGDTVDAEFSIND